MASLIAFFSRAGNNYVNGTIRNLEIGNTETVAMMIQRATGADIFKLEPMVPYSDDYGECIEEAKQDQKQNARPRLEAFPKNMENYNTIYLGYPNYWDTMPMAVFTFLEKFDFSGKTIRPFCTHEGSRMGNSEDDIKALCKGAAVEKGIAILGVRVGDAEELIQQWL